MRKQASFNHKMYVEELYTYDWQLHIITDTFLNLIENNKKISIQMSLLIVKSSSINFMIKMLVL